jgi:hypothetical protein
MLPIIWRISGFFLLNSLLVISPRPSQAQPGSTFGCEIIAGIPTTVVKTVRGKMPMIHWVKSAAGRYNNLSQRCQEVSTRIDRFNRAGQLKFIRTGNVNSYPVLCIDAGVSGNTCPQASVLVTLPKGTDSSQILQQMLDLRARAAGKIIQLSDENEFR